MKLVLYLDCGLDTKAINLSKKPGVLNDWTSIAWACFVSACVRPRYVAIISCFNSSSVWVEIGYYYLVYSASILVFCLSIIIDRK